MMMPPCCVSSRQVAVAPDVGEALEIGGVVFAALRDRSRRPPAWRGRACVHTSSPLRAATPACRLRPRPRPPCRGRGTGFRRGRPGSVGIAEREAGDDVGAAGDGGEAHVALDVPVHIVEALGASGEPVESDGAQAGELVLLCRARHRPSPRRRGTWRWCRRCVMPSSSAMSPEDIAARGWKGEPS